MFDTNILASAFTSSCGAPRALLEDALHCDMQLVTSPALLDEFADCLVAVFRHERRMAAAPRSAIEEIAVVLEPASVQHVCRDPDDDHVLAAGVPGRAEYIVTRGKDLLTLGSHEGIPIVEPAPFLQVVRGAASARLGPQLPRLAVLPANSIRRRVARPFVGCLSVRGKDDLQR